MAQFERAVVEEMNRSRSMGSAEQQPDYTCLRRDVEEFECVEKKSCFVARLTRHVRRPERLASSCCVVLRQYCPVVVFFSVNSRIHIAY